MIVYHFLSAQHALDDLCRRRLKIATFDDLNDPFDLWPIAQPNLHLRRGLRKWRAEMTACYGMLCFSHDWRNPVLWSHYADRHRGVCLGFEVKNEILKNVQYVSERPRLKRIDEALAQQLLFTKYQDWAYEQECRVFSRLEDRDSVTRLYFADFSDNLALRKVIAGPLCATSRKTIVGALRDHAETVTIAKARLAFNTFRVVENRQGFTRSTR